MDVTSFFKPDSKPIRLVVAHSTEDSLGADTLALLRSNLRADVQIVDSRRIADFHELLAFLQKCAPFNVLLLIAHGNRALNTVRLYADVDSTGLPLRVKIGELSILKDQLADKLCMFGVCHFGTDDLATAVCESAGALACIAAKPTYAISKTDIGKHFAALLNKMQQNQHLPLGVDELHDFAKETLPPDLFKNLAISPPRTR